MDWIHILWWVIVLIISAIPLNIAVKLLGGKSSLFKVILVNLILGVINGFIDTKFALFSGILSFVALLFIYKIMFDLGWLRAFLVWILQFVIAFILTLILLFLGISLILV